MVIVVTSIRGSRTFRRRTRINKSADIRAFHWLIWISRQYILIIGMFHTLKYTIPLMIYFSSDTNVKKIFLLWWPRCRSLAALLSDKITRKYPSTYNTITSWSLGNRRTTKPTTFKFSSGFQTLAFDAVHWPETSIVAVRRVLTSRLNVTVKTYTFIIFRTSAKR